MHPVPGRVVSLDRQESTGADMQRHPMEGHPAFCKPPNQRFGKMQTGSRGRDGAVLARKERLIIRPILLVEYANQQRAKGATARDAMIAAGVVRLRPILMTAFSTVAGILPIAIGFGAGAESRRPMGVAVVGGMLTSTFLTLLIIPLVYTVFSDLAERFYRKRGTASLPAVVEEIPAK